VVVDSTGEVVDSTGGVVANIAGEVVENTLGVLAANKTDFGLGVLVGFDSKEGKARNTDCKTYPFVDL
jgi:hypothetical protein